MPIEPVLLRFEIRPLLVMKFLLSRVRAAPVLRTAIVPAASMVMLPDAVVVSAVVVAVLTVTSARAAMGSAPKRAAAAAESIKRCLIKSPTSLFASERP